MCSPEQGYYQSEAEDVQVVTAVEIPTYRVHMQKAKTWQELALVIDVLQLSVQDHMPGFENIPEYMLERVEQ